MKISFDIKKDLGDFVLDAAFEGDAKNLGILGESGCGKSLTLKCIAGIETPDEGRIRVGDRVLFDSEKKINIKPGDRRVGYLFQNYALFPNMTVEQNIAAPLKGTREEKEKLVRELIGTYRLEGLEKRLPRQLSGGQQQRTALARMMGTRPEVILLDEPFSALDAFLKDSMIQEFHDVMEVFGGLTVLVSHSRDEIFRLCSQTAVMDAGRVIRYADTREVFKDPRNIKTAGLTGCKNILRAKRRGDHLLFLPDWECELTTKAVLPERLCALGVRAHYLKRAGAGEKNSVAVDIASTARLVFETQYYLNPRGKNLSPEQQLRWFVQAEGEKEIEREGFPAYLGIPEEAMMFLE